ncbi:hypothetical protein KKF34_15035 [Myxococcota bacterium]|nr:hypothetical protein [Myxococcota bacterium]MBU1498191.1 hypothetical protein [Myxococcota bacterium]
MSSYPVCHFCNDNINKEFAYFGLTLCEECFSGDVIKIMENHGHRFSIRKYEVKNRNANHSPPHTFQIDLIRPQTFFIEMQFHKQNGPHGFLTRLFSGKDPEIGIQEFDDNVKINVPNDQLPLLKRFLLHEQRRELIVWITQHDLSLSIVGTSLTSGRKLELPRFDPSVDELARALVALGVHMAQFAKEI